ncbi:MAG: glycogen/starch/alpha-glucan phosphorylase [Steroidobacteraceae bacterium]
MAKSGNDDGARPTEPYLHPPPPARDAESIRLSFIHAYCHVLGRYRLTDRMPDVYQATAMAVRERIMPAWQQTRIRTDRKPVRRAFYLSLEYLLGRLLQSTMHNLDIEAECGDALHALAIEMEEVIAAEHDAGLGNGGLGRLAACFLDSCASLALPVSGYGIRYRYGIFRQRISDGRQIEDPDSWLREGYPWEIERIDESLVVQFGGWTECYAAQAETEPLRYRWVGTEDVLAVPFDIPVPGYRNGIVNTLRLWSAMATSEFNLDEFNAGSYTESVAAKNAAENITMVLYPNATSENGKELRLRQQYFLASASLQDVLREWCRHHPGQFDKFDDFHCFQLNDTHPAIAVAELMRLLMDVHGLGWDRAFAITQKSMAYTNHTLLPEALETWPVAMFRRLLPRLLDIILEINARMLAQIADRWPGDEARQRRMSLVDESHEPMLRMAHLAIAGSFSVNGVAELHSQLLTERLFRDFHELWPERFNNKTNGVTPRRWLGIANPGLSAVIDSAIGPQWRRDLCLLRELESFADDPGFRKLWRDARQRNKTRMLAQVNHICRAHIDGDMLIDVQVKRIHEYKRQLLNALHAIRLYARLCAGMTIGPARRCVLIGGKAAPGYVMAKTIIKLINNVATIINGDERTNARLQMHFLPDYNVTMMEMLAPGADLSVQISTAGKEASGTGNMKFMLNGAMTIGTLDGANVEILEAVGADNFFLFGLTVEQIDALRPHYDPNTIISASSDFSAVMQMLESGVFNRNEPGIFDSVVASIRDPHDPWMTAADFESFSDAQDAVSAAFVDQQRWTRMSIANCAAAGRFSSDRTIADYNSEIWRLASLQT